MPIWLWYCSLLVQMIGQIKKAKDSVRENTSAVAFDITDVTVKLSATLKLKALSGLIYISTYKYIYFSPTWSCGSRQRDTTSRGRKIHIFV